MIECSFQKKLDTINNMKKEKIIIAGAGLAGSLLGILLARRGYNVEIYEWRPDMRLENISAGKSINLALSNRGLKALRAANMDDYILREVVPMKGRLIHPLSGNKNIQPYSGRSNNYINSVSRGGLNMALMTQAEKYENLKFFFNSKITNIDYDANCVYFENHILATKDRSCADIIIGADGAFSAVRHSFQTGAIKRFDYSQSYLAHGYKELAILPDENGNAKMETDVLHIWPRHDFMMIALPNFDNSFTCTLFMPWEGEIGFDNINTPDKLEKFFKEFFPDIIPHLPDYQNQFFDNPTGALVTVKCYPWNLDDKALILGDAAHAVVPFYGQGMNASFEDCLVLDSLIDEHSGNWSEILPRFTELRHPNGIAIADLAVQNYYEMRDHVASEQFIKKRKLELALEEKYSDFNSKYSLVTFADDVEYRDAKTLGELQDEYLMKLANDNSEITTQLLDVAYTYISNLKKGIVK